MAKWSASTDNLRTPCGPGWPPETGQYTSLGSCWAFRQLLRRTITYQQLNSYMEFPSPCLENYWRPWNHRLPPSWRTFGSVPPVSPLSPLLALNHHQTHPGASLQPLLSSSDVEPLAHLSHHCMTALIRCWPPAPNSSPSRWEAGQTQSQSTGSNPAWRQR